MPLHQQQLASGLKLEHSPSFFNEGLFYGERSKVWDKILCKQAIANKQEAYLIEEF
jgi:hypothetical protein